MSNQRNNYTEEVSMPSEGKSGMHHCTSLPLPQNELHELIEKAKDWMLMNGACMRSKTNFNRDALQFAPFILIPSPFPRKEFAQACEIQLILNELMHRVANDYEFLKETLKAIIKADYFTKKLFDIYETVYSEGFTQKTSLALLRSDLMLNTSCPKDKCRNHKPYCCWKQVEINTIASGFGWLGPAAGKLHKFVLQELGLVDELKNLPENHALEGLCTGMIEAWQLYNDPKAVILFIIEDVTYNICDQRFHEFEIRRLNPNIKVIRRTLTQIASEACLGEKKELLVGHHTVAFVYYRCGYEPGQYHSEKEWDARLLIERSLAIKCPSIQYHLAGSKKVQQALARPDIVSRFLKDEKTVERVREIFTAVPDAIHAIAKYEIEAEPREIYLFREGTAVLWNISELECGNLLQFLKAFEEDRYSEKLVQSESELMSYTYTEQGKKSHLKDGNIMLARHATELDKYTFSNAIALSVKLGIWEASLEHYIDSIAFVTEDLKSGRRIEMSREEVLRKQGQLFALRHLINLSSDLLDTPDFYWERDELESLFQQTCSYFSISKRTRVMNEKINHCVELVELLSSHLSDRHHIRLEWMIIVLIMVEVGFEILHYVDRFFDSQRETIQVKES